MNKIDMSPLVNSRVLCEFSNCADFVNSSVDFLAYIDPVTGYYRRECRKENYTDDYKWKYCRVFPNQWIANVDEILKSIPSGVYVDVEYASYWEADDLYRAKSGVYDGLVLLPGSYGHVTLNFIKIRAIRVLHEMEDWEY